MVPKSDKQQILVCQNCALNFKNRVEIDKLTNTYINGCKNLTVSAYFNMLTTKIQSLAEIYRNLVKTQEQFLKQSAIQVEKHRRYYNSILEIIENSMQESEKIQRKYINQGENTIREKKQEVQNIMKNCQNQLKKLLEFQDKSMQFPLSPFHKQTKFNVQGALKNLSN